MSVSTIAQDETTNIPEYIRKMAPTMLSEYLRQQRPKKEEEEEEPSWKAKLIAICLLTLDGNTLASTNTVKSEMVSCICAISQKI